MAETNQIPKILDSDDYALDVMELTQINLRKKALSFRHNNRVNSVAFSIDGKYVASGSDDKSINVWNLIDPKEQFTLTEISSISIPFSSSKIFNSTFSEIPKNDSFFLKTAPSNSLNHNLTDPLLSTSNNSTTSTKLTNIKSIAFSPNGKILAGGLDDGKVILWNFRNNLTATIKGVRVLGC